MRTKLNKIAQMVIFSLIVMVLTSYVSISSTLTNTDSETGTVHVHYPLIINPVMPPTEVNLDPYILSRVTGENRTYYLWSNNAIYSFNNIGANAPKAIFGINGDPNAPIILTYETHFLDGVGLTCNGGWVKGNWNWSTFKFTPLGSLNGGGLAGSGNSGANLGGTGTTTVWGYDNTRDWGNYGGLWVAAYVSDITVGPNANITAITDENQLIFTITAAYNF